MASTDLIWENLFNTKLNASTQIFPKWVSQNSPNSMNHGKVQKWEFLILFPDEVLPRGNKEDILSITIVGNASVAMTALNNTVYPFEFCHD